MISCNGKGKLECFRVYFLVYYLFKKNVFLPDRFSSAFHVVKLMDRSIKSVLGYGFELRELNMMFISVSTVEATVKYSVSVVVLVSNTGLEDAGVFRSKNLLT